MAQYHLLPRTDASVSMFLASILFFFFFWPDHMTYGILDPQPVMEGKGWRVSMPSPAHPFPSSHVQPGRSLKRVLLGF